MPSPSAGPSAYDRIRQAIVEGVYHPGQRLVEQRIASDFDLSRTPVREALRSLAAEGLVVSEVNRGAMVRPIAAREIEDLYELRSLLESYAASRAASRRTEDQLATMAGAIAAFEEAIGGAASGDLQAVRSVNAWNQEFHQAVLAAADHERLSVMLRRATDVPLVFQAFRHYDENALRRSNLFHQMTAEAIAAGDAERAGRLMHEHIDQGRDVLLANSDQIAELLEE